MGIILEKVNLKESLAHIGNSHSEETKNKNINFSHRKIFNTRNKG